MKVLITRSEVDAEPLAALLYARQVETLIDPMISIELIPGTSLDLSGVQALLMTSANGVRAYCANNSERQIPLFSVGDATAREAVGCGFENISTAGGDVSHLAELVQSQLSRDGGALLHVAGTITAGDLGNSLIRAGFEYRREALYNAIAAETLRNRTIAALINNELQGVLLYSPRTADIFCHCVGKDPGADMLNNVTAYCLSTAVADKAKVVKWGSVVIASKPTQFELLCVVEDGI